eukprot:COSAG04_NODE_3891_length_2445_cov_3.224638_2_plen_203_part_00
MGSRARESGLCPHLVRARAGAEGRLAGLSEADALLPRHARLIEPTISASRWRKCAEETQSIRRQFGGSGIEAKEQILLHGSKLSKRSIKRVESRGKLTRGFRYLVCAFDDSGLDLGALDAHRAVAHVQRRQRVNVRVPAPQQHHPSIKRGAHNSSIRCEHSKGPEGSGGAEKAASKRPVVCVLASLLTARAAARRSSSQSSR